LFQERKEREARAAEDGWTVVVHHKGRKKTTDTESGTAVGSVSLVAMQEKMAKKKPKEVDMNFYRFQKREAHLSGMSSLLNRTILIFNYSVVTTHDGTKIMLICSRHSMKLFAIPVWGTYSFVFLVQNWQCCRVSSSRTGKGYRSLGLRGNSSLTNSAQTAQMAEGLVAVVSGHSLLTNNFVSLDVV